MNLETEIYQILRKHRLSLKKREEVIVDLLDFIKKRDKAMNYSQCCTELICVDNVNYEYLTLGKKYSLGCETDNYYRVENDLGHVVDMSKVRFEKVIAN